MTWLDVVSPLTVDFGEGGNAGYSARVVIPSASLSNTGLDLARVAFFSASDEGLYITKAYIGTGADVGDVYDFADTPTQLLFGGNAYKLIAANDFEYSDSVAFSIQSGKNLIISFYIDAGQGANDAIGVANTAGVDSYYKYGDSAVDIDVAGYSTYPDVRLSSLRIEAALSEAAIPVFMNQYKQRSS
jgi:hypothetical protein